mmetsp:Transcript_69748/g.145764  ORF Transcript_69748/g.145764 Transcript_69748/m.145764 type:complete len:542 (-) Transcript_69748:341-1966(-)
MGNVQGGDSGPPMYLGCTGLASWQKATFIDSTIFDVYEIGGLLGSGTFGQVRLCWPIDRLDQDEKYAVKVVDSKSELFKQATSLLSAKQEANILKGLKHRHVVELVDVYQRERWLFMVMEYVPGGEVFSALSDPDLAVSEDSVALVGRQLLLALEFLHSRSIVHRDVKAENVLLASNPKKTGTWHVKLIDFGLATRTENPTCYFPICRDQDLPLEELICGTAYYCAPEVWTNNYSPKVDIWAAGVIVHLALLGLFPYQTGNAAQLESLICNPDEHPTFQPACRKECPDYRISSDSRDALESLLNKNSEERPSASAALTLPFFLPAEERRRQCGTSAAWGYSLDFFRPMRSVTLSDNFERSSTTGSQDSEEAHNRPILGGPTLLGSRAQSEDLKKRRPSGIEACLLERLIPLPIRRKAGRLAARPEVDPNKEMSRTKALDTLRRRAVAGFIPDGERNSYVTGWYTSEAQESESMSPEDRIRTEGEEDDDEKAKERPLLGRAASGGRLDPGSLEPTDDGSPSQASAAETEIDDQGFLSTCMCH